MAMRVKQKRKEPIEMRQIGVVAVDSGQLLIIDPCRAVHSRLTDPQQISTILNYLKKHGEAHETPTSDSTPPTSLANARCDLPTYEEMCEVTSNGNGGGQARKVSTGKEESWQDGIAGVVSRTAYGDDLYPVFHVYEGDELMGIYVQLDGLHCGGSDGIGRWLTSLRKRSRNEERDAILAG